MRSTSSRRGHELGSVNWAFVITLFLLLGFVFLWYQAADERDQAKAERQTAVQGIEKLKGEATAAGAMLQETSQVLGFASKTITVGGNQYTASDLDVARRHLQPDGKVEVDVAGAKTEVPGFYNWVRNGLTLQMSQSARTASSAAVTTKEVDFGWATTKFKEQLKQVGALAAAVPPKPTPPTDPGDAAAQAKYRADLESFTRAFDAYMGAMKALNAGEFQGELKRFKQVIGLPGVQDADTVKVVEVNYGAKVDVSPTSFQDLLTLPQAPFAAIGEDFRLNKEADLASIAKLTADLKAERQQVAEAATRFTTFQQQVETDLSKLRADLEAANSLASRNEARAVKAEQVSATVESEAKAEKSRLTSQNSALQEAVRGNKEKADLEIRRDDPDGRILSVSNERGTASINLGSKARAYPGLRFAVSYVDRGGARVGKGEVQVIRVTGEYSSEVRITGAASTFVAGDLISNPLFDAGRDIHVYCVGWTPDLIQRRRFAEMNVIVDARPSGDTDWFIVPDEWLGGEAAAPAEGSEEGEAPAAGASPLDKAKQEAQTFGASVITRRMIEAFLKL
jgi:hypothetical protein